jgi:YaiO family outer membrane protein
MATTRRDSGTEPALPSKLSFSLGATVGTGNLAPAWRFDGTVSKPVLAKQNLILNFRVKEEQSNYVNSSSGVSAGFVYYFPRYWIVEVNGRYEIGQPGSTDSTGISGALTWGLYKKIYVTAGFDYGDSSYVVVGDDQVVVDLTGRTFSLAVQHYVRPHWGWSARIEAGSNDLYAGRGIQVGLFREW